MTTQATITIPYNEFESIKRAQKKAEERVAELEKRIREEKVAASDEVILKLAKNALVVTRYAVASLPPESNKNWPFNELREIAVLLPLMPDAEADHRELATTFEMFALECERYDLRRRELKIDPQTLMPIAPR